MTMIVADTTCGLPRDILTQRGIPLIPQVVIFGEDSYHDDKDLDTATFLQKLKASATLPKTAAPEPPLYFPIYKEAQEQRESVIEIILFRTCMMILSLVDPLVNRTVDDGS